MAQPYVGEIRMFAGNFAPAGWMLCDGQLLAISENDTLFNLIGTTYGGDGQETFALPNLQSRIPLHQGNGFTLAQMAGEESVTLNVQQMPTHNHAMLASSAAGQNSTPGGNVTAQHPTASLYTVAPGAGSLLNTVISQVGGNQPHENCQPFLCINFIISLFGIFPSPS